MPNEIYNVTLFFTEIYWSRPGQRLFNVSANNQTAVALYDIFTAAGEALWQQCLPEFTVSRPMHCSGMALDDYLSSSTFSDSFPQYKPLGH